MSLVDYNEYPISRYYFCDLLLLISLMCLHSIRCFVRHIFIKSVQYMKKVFIFATVL